MSRFHEHVVVLTGAAGGQGRASAEAFAAEGANLLLVDRDARVHHVAQELSSAAGVHALGMEADVGEPSTWDSVNRELDRFPPGRLVLVNNAGIYARAAVDEQEVDVVDRLYRVNQRSILLSVGRLLERLKLRGGGSVVNISSTAGVTGEPFISAYAGTKWAVRGITRSLAAELGQYGVRVNAVVPGLIDTPLAAANGEEVVEQILARTFLGRIGQPNEIVPAVLLLASPEASYITGADLVVDAGLSL